MKAISSDSSGAVPMSQPRSTPFPPLVLTLKLDRPTFERLNALRQTYFPPERNFLPAHLTLFHALPGEEEITIQRTLNHYCRQIPYLPLQFSHLRHLGRGVAIAVECSDLVALQAKLATLWHPWLSKQDHQRFKPHITIQNKVSPEASRHLYHHLAKTWQPLSGVGEGLLLWHYQGGPWTLSMAFQFQSSAQNHA